MQCPGAVRGFAGNVLTSENLWQEGLWGDDDVVKAALIRHMLCMEETDRNAGFNVREVLKAGCGGGKEMATSAFAMIMGEVRPNHGVVSAT